MKLELHSVDDWEILYVDGKAESLGNHSGVFEHWIKYHAEFPLTITSFKSEYHEDDAIGKYVHWNGDFPLSLKKLRDIEKNPEWINKELPEWL